jgi:hypothetical protein
MINGNDLAKISLQSLFNKYLSLHSDSSTAASILRRTNPTATPISTRTFMMAAILNISSAALHVEESAPPPLLLPCDVALNELTTLAKHCSVDTGKPRDTTVLLWALRPPKEFSAPRYTTLFILFWVLLLLLELNKAAVTVAEVSPVVVMAIANANPSTIWMLKAK